MWLKDKKTCSNVARNVEIISSYPTAGRCKQLIEPFYTTIESVRSEGVGFLFAVADNISAYRTQEDLIRGRTPSNLIHQERTVRGYYARQHR